MSDAVLCPSCHSTVQADARACWLCGHLMKFPLPPGRVVPNEPVDRGIAWAVVVVLAVPLLALVGLELAYEAPGIAVVYACVIAPVCGVLVRIAYTHRIDFWNARAFWNLGSPQPVDARSRTATYRDNGPLDARGEPVNPPVTSRLLHGLAFAASTISAVIGIIVILTVAAVVIFFLICVGMSAF